MTIPRHDCMRLIANSEQNISALTSRRLLTYEKIAAPELNQRANGNGSSDPFIESVGDFRSK